MMLVCVSVWYLPAKQPRPAPYPPPKDDVRWGTGQQEKGSKGMYLGVNAEVVLLRCVQCVVFEYLDEGEAGQRLPRLIPAALALSTHDAHPWPAALFFQKTSVL